MADQALDSNVIDLSLFGGDMKTVQYLRTQGIVNNDDDMSKLLIAKRVNRAATAEFPVDCAEDKSLVRDVEAARREFNQKKAALSSEALIQEGHVNTLLVKYVDALARNAQLKLDRLQGDEQAKMTPESFNEQVEKLEKRVAKYTGERDYYANNPDMVKQAATQFKDVVKSDKYLPLGKIVADSGLVNSDPALAQDLVADVLARQNARIIQNMAGLFPDADFMELYKKVPEQYTTQIDATAERILRNTKPVNRQHDCECEIATGLDQIQAMTKLLGAEMNQAVRVEGAGAKMAAISAMQEKVKKYTQVAASLSHAFLSEGPAAADSRIATMKHHLENEMNTKGIQLMDKNTAKAAAAELVRESAAHLVHEATSETDVTRIMQLANIAGVGPAVVEPKPLARDSQAPQSFVDGLKSRILPFSQAARGAA